MAYYSEESLDKKIDVFKNKTQIRRIEFDNQNFTDDNIWDVVSYSGTGGSYDFVLIPSSSIYKIIDNIRLVQPVTNSNIRFGGRDDDIRFGDFFKTVLETRYIRSQSGLQIVFGANSATGNNKFENDQIVFYCNETPNNWFARCSSGGTTTQVDTGVTIANDTVYKLKIVADTISALFYINDILVATINNNIPASEILKHRLFSIRTGAGTHYSYLDYIDYRFIYNNIR